VGLTRRRVLVLGLATTGLLAACQSAAPASPTAAPARTQPTEPAWEALVKAAQVENTVVLRGPPTGAVRTNVPKAFKEAFGIDVQYTGGSSAAVVT